MENRLLCIVLAIVMVSPLSALADDSSSSGQVVRDADPGSVLDPQIERRRVREADIDTENFEIGTYAGILSIEDFGAQPVVGSSKR